MQIKLYSENDTRPVGTYEFACSAYVSPFSILFVSQTGVQILSSLRHKITMDAGDDLKHNLMNQTYEIIGVTKKQFEEIQRQVEQVKIDANTTKQRTTSKRSAAGVVPGASENAGGDSDEKFIPRTRRKAARASDQREEGNLFSDDPTRID